MKEECAGYWEGLTGWIPLLIDRWPEVINIMLSIIVIVFITVNTTLRSMYKFTLLPLLALLVVSSILKIFFGRYNSVSVHCHWQTFLSLIFRLAAFHFHIHHFVILHSLIRAQLMDKFSKLGIVYSIVIPILLYCVPVVIHECGFAPFYKLEDTMECVTGITNVFISIHQICRGNSPGLAKIIFVYESMYLLPFILKLLILRYFFNIDIMQDIFNCILVLDNFVFIAVFVVCIFILRLELKCTKSILMENSLSNFELSEIYGIS